MLFLFPFKWSSLNFLIEVGDVAGHNFLMPDSIFRLKAAISWIRNFLYRAYLRIPKKIDFEGTPNFNPLTTKKKKLDSLLQIEDNYFTNKKNVFQ